MYGPCWLCGQFKKPALCQQPEAHLQGTQYSLALTLCTHSSLHEDTAGTRPCTAAGATYTQRRLCHAHQPCRSSHARLTDSDIFTSSCTLLHWCTLRHAALSDLGRLFPAFGAAGMVKCCTVRSCHWLDIGCSIDTAICLLAGGWPAGVSCTLSYALSRHLFAIQSSCAL